MFKRKKKKYLIKTERKTAEIENGNGRNQMLNKYATKQKHYSYAIK